MDKNRSSIPMNPDGDFDDDLRIKVKRYFYQKRKEENIARTSRENSTPPAGDANDVSQSGERPEGGICSATTNHQKISVLRPAADLGF
jgi:hypothetical protein